jgi:osmotically inducible lipoprotein OsmB
MFEVKCPHRSGHMKKALILAASLALASCGTQTGDRMASGAGIGAGTGAVFGGVGALPGAIVGAAAGAFTSPKKVNLGEPVWD